MTVIKQVPNLFHCMWLQGIGGRGIPLSVNQNICLWHRHFVLASRRLVEGTYFQIILWVDEECHKNLHLTGKVTDYMPEAPSRRSDIVLNLLHINELASICYYSPFNQPDVIIPVCLTSDAFMTTEDHLIPTFDTLKAAFDFEVQQGLVIVATDILRMIIAYKYGGIYSDLGGITPRNPGNFFIASQAQFADENGFQPGLANNSKIETGFFIAIKQSPSLSIMLQNMAGYFFNTPNRRMLDYQSKFTEGPVEAQEALDRAREISEGLRHIWSEPLADPSMPSLPPGPPLPPPSMMEEKFSIKKWFSKGKKKASLQRSQGGSASQQSSIDEQVLLGEYFSAIKTGNIRLIDSALKKLRFPRSYQANITQSIYEATFSHYWREPGMLAEKDPAQEQKGHDYYQLWNSFYKQYINFKHGIFSWTYPGSSYVEEAINAKKTIDKKFMPSFRFYRGRETK